MAPHLSDRPAESESNPPEPVESAPNRRAFLAGLSTSSLAAMLGASIPYAANWPRGLAPVALGADEPAAPMSGEVELLKTSKDGLTMMTDRPICAQTPAHLLDDAVTPAERHFVRNNGLLPEAVIKGDATGWTLTIDGEVDKPLKLSLDDLKKNYEVVTRQIVIECGGNGRAFYSPGTSGTQWTLGAVGCSKWTGVRLRDVLKSAGVKKTAVYTGHYGADEHLSRQPGKVAISRGVPIEKAMEENTLIAFAMNGQAIPALNGFPLRLIVPGWAGSCSQKWLTRVWVRDVKHDGSKMESPAYSMPNRPVAPGEKVDHADFVTITSMPVKSLITWPRTGLKLAAGKAVEVRGHAWAGDRVVQRMDVSMDFGQTWIAAELDKPVNPYAWQRWRASLTPPVAGYYEVWARATDSDGVAQPPVSPGWNPKGYLNNIQHRIALFAT